jgi:hypothetical protein
MVTLWIGLLLSLLPVPLAQRLKSQGLRLDVMVCVLKLGWVLLTLTRMLSSVRLHWSME